MYRIIKLSVVSCLLTLLFGSLSLAQCPESYVFDSVEVSSFDGNIDVNNDGYDDIIIGSMTASSNGAIFVHSGKTGLLLYTIHGNISKYGYGFGRSVGGVGDINKDGCDDFVGTGQSSKGSFLFSGKDGSILREIPYYGEAIDGAGDVNNDGTLDIILGDKSGKCSNGTSSGAGRVVVISGANGSVLHDLYGTCPDAWNPYPTKFGNAVAGMGDLNDDGHSDFAIGIPDKHIYMNQKFWYNGEVQVISGADGAILYKWHTGMMNQEYDNYHFGYSLDNVGDMDLDGYDDIVIGHDWAYNSIARKDSAWVFSGKYVEGNILGTIIHAVTNNSTTSHKFGMAVSAAGDVNLDGYPDFAVGDPKYGIMYVFSGNDGSILDRRYSSRAPGYKKTGYALAFAGDVNGDGKGDILSLAQGDALQVFTCIFPEPACLADGDSDGDGFGNLCDNCPDDYNPLQTDSDHDGIGDECDECTDTDLDGLCSTEDNCPLYPNPGQEDADGDGVGDVCDGCPDINNPDQADTDGDGFQDVCDVCPDKADPYQLDSDNDGHGDHCDNCQYVINPDQLDTDGDKDGDLCDNCPEVSNSAQYDADNDGIGNECDECTDIDGDGYGHPGLVYLGVQTCEIDNCPNDYNPDGQFDTDDDGYGDACDNCPDNDNPNQEDWNSDGVGDSCTTMIPAPTGDDVVVDLGSGVNITIGEITNETSVEIYTTEGDDLPPNGAFTILPGGATVYHIDVAWYTNPPYTICITYDDFGMSAVDESKVALWHSEIAWVPGVGYDTAWYDVTTTRDTILNTVCGETQSLSPFTVGIIGSKSDVSEQIGFDLPNDFRISQNYPNPFNPQTVVEYSVATRSLVLIEVFNIMGQNVRTLVDESVQAGTYQVTWDGNDSRGNKVSSGVYLYRFQAGDFVQTRKMVLLK